MRESFVKNSLYLIAATLGTGFAMSLIHLGHIPKTIDEWIPVIGIGICILPLAYAIGIEGDQS